MFLKHLLLCVQFIWLITCENLDTSTDNVSVNSSVVEDNKFLEGTTASSNSEKFGNSTSTKLYDEINSSIKNDTDTIKQALTDIFPKSEAAWLKVLEDLEKVPFKCDECKRQIIAYVGALTRLEMWALQMMDATAKIQPGILNGNLAELGDFNECLKINYQSKDFGLVKGQHCTLFADVGFKDLFSKVLMLPYHVRSNISVSNDVPREDVDKIQHLAKEQRLSMILDRLISTAGSENEDIPDLPMGFGVCLPASCSSEDVHTAVNYFLRNLNITVKENYDQDMFCSTMEDTIFSTWDWSCIGMLLTILTLIILSTGYEIRNRLYSKDKSPLNPLYCVFSLWRNGSKLFSLNEINPKNPGDTIHNITGIRALSAVWVVFLHRFYRNTIITPVRNNSSYADFVKSYISSFFYGSSHSVDTFLTISGVLVSYNFFKPTNKTEKFNILMFYFHRYLRITPPLAAFLVFKASLMTYLGSGPYWKFFMDPVNCRDNWWSSLLYVENYFTPMNICNVPTWSLSVDMQCFIISPIILILLKKWPKFGVGLIIALLMGSVGIVFTMATLKDIPATSILMDGETSRQMNTTYVPTHGRYGPWLMGLLFGYLMRETDFKLSKIMLWLSWGMCLSDTFGVLFGVYPFVQFIREVSFLEGTFYQSFNRLSWSSGVCWIIYACHRGHGGPINWFLSLPFWQPISKLSYCIYLIHFPMQMAIKSSTKEYMNFDVFQSIHEFWGDFGIVLCLATLWTLAFELPVFAIESLFWRRPKKRSSITATTNGIEVIENGTKKIESNEVTTSF